MLAVTELCTNVEADETSPFDVMVTEDTEDTEGNRVKRQTLSSFARWTAESGCPHIEFLRVLRGNAFSWYFQFPFESVI